MTINHPARTLNCKGRLIELTEPLIMGVLNVTPDSFYDGGQFQQENTAIEQIEKMLNAGADIIDIGGMSTRPGADTISAKEELSRVLPVIEGAINKFPDIIISIDTIHSMVAKEAVSAGASMVNDISGGSMDDNMLSTVASMNVPYILMHMKGSPENMQDAPQYDDVALEILDFFISHVNRCKEAGVTDIIIDPGLGFGKTLEDNYSILQRLEIFDMLELPILIGASRKSMIYRLLDVSPDESLNGTTVVNTMALLKGVDILRVHDVKEAVECRVICQAYQSTGN